MKKPALYALVAIVYIILLVSLVNFTSRFQLKDNILMPMTMLGVFVISASVMAFLFLSEPFKLYMEGQKREAMIFFGKTLGIFACFVFILSILIFLV